MNPAPDNAFGPNCRKNSTPGIRCPFPPKADLKRLHGENLRVQPPIALLVCRSKWVRQALLQFCYISANGLCSGGEFADVCVEGFVVPDKSSVWLVGSPVSGFASDVCPRFGSCWHSQGVLLLLYFTLWLTYRISDPHAN